MNRRPERIGDLLPGVLADLAARHGIEPPATLTNRTPAMPKFRKKPVEIEAVQFTGYNLEELDAFTLGFRLINETSTRGGLQVAEVWDHLHSTWVGVKVGDWIIRGVQGEFYPCDADVFAATYEPVDGVA